MLLFMRIYPWALCLRAIPIINKYIKILVIFIVVVIIIVTLLHAVNY